MAIFNSYVKLPEGKPTGMGMVWSKFMPAIFGDGDDHIQGPAETNFVPFDLFKNTLGICSSWKGWPFFSIPNWARKFTAINPAITKILQGTRRHVQISFVSGGTNPDHGGATVQPARLWEGDDLPKSLTKGMWKLAWKWWIQNDDIYIYITSIINDN